jgi:hypothetical protein
MRDDKSYFRHRAQTEIEHAQRATKAAVVEVHNQLAQAYLQKLATLEQLPTERS